MSEGSALGVAQALDDHAELVLADWLETFEHSPLRFPGPVDRPKIEALVEPAFRALAQAAVGEPEVARPGTHRLRETERLFAFIGASLASSTVSSRRSSAFDASALGVALRDALCRRANSDAERRSLEPLCDWLTAVLVESFAAAGAQGERERFHELLENRVSVVAISPTVAAALVVGDAQCSALASALERLVLQIARIGARAVVIDVSALDSGEMPHHLQALEQFVSHRKIAGAVKIAAVGLSNAATSAWTRLAASHGADLVAFESFLEASVWAHEPPDPPLG